jgi:pimeloyl-ACP methyl ester carboxylesterase
MPTSRTERTADKDVSSARAGRRRRLLVRVLLPVVLLLLIAAALYTPDIPRDTLESRYLASPTDLRAVAHTTLHVRDDGPRDAPAVIMLHGMGASLHTWEPWARALADDYRVIRFDLPGHGLTPPDPTGDYRDARSHALLAALMDSLGVERATLIGNSMGGRIAWSFAAAYPHRVHTLVLISPDGFASPGFEYDTPPDVPPLLSLMRVALPRWMLRSTLEPAYADASVLTDSLTRRYHELLLAPGAREAMLDRMRQTVLTDPISRLQRIRAPTLLLWGEADAMIPIDNAQDYLDAMPEARLVRLPGLGHLPFEEAPAATVDVVRAFLDEGRARS